MSHDIDACSAPADVLPKYMERKRYRHVPHVTRMSKERMIDVDAHVYMKCRKIAYASFFYGNQTR